MPQEAQTCRYLDIQKSVGCNDTEIELYGPARVPYRFQAGTRPSGRRVTVRPRTRSGPGTLRLSSWTCPPSCRR
jgi:hypothetical protein